jgi:hypothetical protein
MTPEATRKNLFVREGDYRLWWVRRLMAEGKRAEAKQQLQPVSMLYADHPKPNVASYDLGMLYFVLNEPLEARVFMELFLTMESDGPRAENVRRALSRLNSGKPAKETLS